MIADVFYPVTLLLSMPRKSSQPITCRLPPHNEDLLYEKEMEYYNSLTWLMYCRIRKSRVKQSDKGSHKENIDKHQQCRCRDKYSIKPTVRTDVTVPNSIKNASESQRQSDENLERTLQEEQNRCCPMHEEIFHMEL